MKKITTQLKSGFHQKDSIEERLHLLKDKYKDETAYIVGCGPSLKNYNLNKLKSFLQDKFVLGIKQTYDILEDIIDIHLLNFCNFAEYDWSNNESIVTWAIFEQFHPQMIFQNKLECDENCKTCI